MQAKEVKNIIIIVDSLIIIWQMRSPASAKSSSLVRMIDQVQRIAGILI